jgi:hypothetical protein
MTSTLLNIAGKIDPQTVSTIGTVSRVITGLVVPYAIIGATVRDLVLHYGHIVFRFSKVFFATV